MFEVFASPILILPRWLLELNLLRAFLWYIALLFILSILLRIRFYHSIVDLTQHVQQSCPKIYALIHEHLFLCLRDGLLLWVGLYAAVFIPYASANNFIWPTARVTFSQLGDFSPALLASVLALAGVMFTIDLYLVAQIAVLDIDRIKNDLNWSERWLSGGVYQMLDYLGKWNPIKQYADSLTRDNIRWLNKVFRNSLWSMSLQMAIRFSLGVLLYACYLLGVQGQP